MSESNYLTTQRGRSVRNIFLQSILIVLPLAGFLIALMYFANKNNHNAKVLITVAVVPYSIGTSIYIIYIMNLLVKRWNRTINIINFESEKVNLETFPIFWYKQKKFTINISRVTLKKTVFPWYGKEKKEGIVIKINNKDEFYLVKDYFDDYETIKNQLNVS